MLPVHHGMARMTTETRSYAGTVECTSDANDFCQKAVSISTSARLPNFSTRPKKTAIPKVSFELIIYRVTGLTGSGLHSQKRALIIALNIVIRGFDFLV